MKENMDRKMKKREEDGHSCLRALAACAKLLEHGSKSGQEHMLYIQDSLNMEHTLTSHKQNETHVPSVFSQSVGKKIK